MERLDDCGLSKAVFDSIIAIGGVPARFRYIAMDKCGWWFAYTHRPARARKIWYIPDPIQYAVEQRLYPRFIDLSSLAGDWKDSLIELVVYREEM